MVAEQHSSIVSPLDSLELSPTGLCDNASKTSVAKLKVHERFRLSRPGTKLFIIEIIVCIARPVLVRKAREPWKRFRESRARGRDVGEDSSVSKRACYAAATTSRRPGIDYCST
jgi:hypothetical protein